MLNISNIQHFSVGDGDGIRTTVFFKGCNLRCPWCHNPENLQFTPSVLHYKNLKKTEVLGKLISAEGILPELLEDADFFETSGGGITLSGGEVMLQAKEVAGLAALLKEKGLSVLIDTAGCVPYSQFQLLNPVVDGYLFDYKTGDAQRYADIGGNLQLVQENITRLLQDQMTVHIRIPLIPGFNTNEADIRQICDQLQALGVKEVELLPFHRLGSSKYDAMGMEYPYREQKPFEKDELRAMASIYKTYFEVKVEGHGKSL